MNEVIRQMRAKMLQYRLLGHYKRAQRLVEIIKGMKKYEKINGDR